MPIIPRVSRKISVDPYMESRYSSPVNALTRVITGGEDVIMNFSDESFNLTLTSPTTVTIGPGVAIKDDVVIHVKETFELDFEDEDHYLGSSGMSMAGNYILVLSYQYARTIPAPQASYHIIKDRSLYTNSPELFIFLGVASVVSDGGSGWEIDSISLVDFEESPPTRRIYPSLIPDEIDGGPIVP